MNYLRIKDRSELLCVRRFSYEGRLMFGRAVIAISWVLTLIATAVGGFVLWSAINAEAAPAQGAAAAVACGLVIIPYVFTRALEALNSKPKE